MNRTSKITYQKAKYRENPEVQLTYEKCKYLKIAEMVIKKWSTNQILKLKNNIKRGTKKIQSSIKKIKNSGVRNVKKRKKAVIRLRIFSTNGLIVVKLKKDLTSIQRSCKFWTSSSTHSIRGTYFIWNLIIDFMTIYLLQRVSHVTKC